MASPYSAFTASLNKGFLSYITEEGNPLWIKRSAIVGFHIAKFAYSEYRVWAHYNGTSSPVKDCRTIAEAEGFIREQMKLIEGK